MSAPPTPRRITCRGTNGVELVGDVYGPDTAPSVLLMHGGGQTRQSWGGTATALAARGFQAVTVDIRGHGESEWDPDGDYSWDAYVGDVVAWAELLGTPAMVGASLGGLVALLATGSRAQQGLAPVAKAVVLVDIAHRAEEEGAERIVAFMTSRPDGFASLDEAADAVAEYLHHRTRPSDTSGLARNLRLGADGRYRWHWDPAMLTQRSRQDPADIRRNEELASAIDVPVLLVRGGMSDVLSEDVAREFLHLVPHAEYVDVAGAHHMVAGDRNDAFTDSVAEFLSRVL